MASYAPAITEDEARSIIKRHDAETVIDAAKRFANCHVADVNDDGNVWIENPCTGHWLGGDKLCGHRLCPLDPQHQQAGRAGAGSRQSSEACCVRR
jgi:hypothetical protein